MSLESSESLPPDVTQSPYYNEDLAPTTPAQRTWSATHLASLWIGMSVCTPTYMLGAGLIASGMSWSMAFLTIVLGNLIVLVPMILNGHPGTKYGIPFPVLVRSSFGLKGSNVPGLLRAIVACGWFGIQTWIGGSALLQLVEIPWPELGHAAKIAFLGISFPELVAFLVFWLMNVYFIVRGTESIKKLEAVSAPVLIVMGIALLWVMSNRAGGLGTALQRSEDFSKPSVGIVRLSPEEIEVRFSPLKDAGQSRAEKVSFAERREDLEKAVRLPLMDSVRLRLGDASGPTGDGLVQEPASGADSGQNLDEGLMSIPAGTRSLFFRFHGPNNHSSILERSIPKDVTVEKKPQSPWLLFFASLTAMVGFWATLSLNIPDFTRYASNQRTQVLGQAMGLPTTMALYSFVGIAVTCAAVAAFSDILVVEDAPWDPVNLLKRSEFQNGWIIALSMIGLTVATLTTNIAANVVSPANDFSNLAPRLISFKAGGLLTAVLGILIMPWKLIASTQGYIFTWLIGYGALLGPIGGIMIADYWVVRRRQLKISGLYRPEGDPPEGVRWAAMWALILGVLPNIPGFLAASFPEPFATSVPVFFQDLYVYAWFLGFGLSFLLYVLFCPRPKSVEG